MSLLGGALSAADHHEDALAVGEANLSMLRRVGAPAHSILITQSNLAGTYRSLGRLDDCLRTQGDVYSIRLKLYGEEHEETLKAANNYANCLIDLKRFKEAKSLLRKTL